MVAGISRDEFVAHSAQKAQTIGRAETDSITMRFQSMELRGFEPLTSWVRWKSGHLRTSDRNL
jgi:hypothetical protein